MNNGCLSLCFPLSIFHSCCLGRYFSIRFVYCRFVLLVFFFVFFLLEFLFWYKSLNHDSVRCDSFLTAVCNTGDQFIELCVVCHHEKLCYHSCYIVVGFNLEYGLPRTVFIYVQYRTEHITVYRKRRYTSPNIITQQRTQKKNKSRNDMIYLVLQVETMDCFSRTDGRF